MKKSIAAMGFTMILQEDSPALGCFGFFGALPYPARDGSLRNIKTKLGQFTMNARSAPGGILGNHAENQFLTTLYGLASCQMPFDGEKSNSGTGGIRRDVSVRRSQE